MDGERVIQAIAQAKLVAEFPNYKWWDFTPDEHEILRNEARVILAALHTAGLVVVDVGELKKLQMCRARLAAVTAWLEENRAEVFRHGLWDAVHTAEEAEAVKPVRGGQNEQR